MSEVIATYLVHSIEENLEKKAEGIALGLTVGSWTDLPQLEQQQLKKHKGRVVSVQKDEVVIRKPNERNYSNCLPRGQFQSRPASHINDDFWQVITGRGNQIN